MLVYQRVTPISLGFMVDIIYLYFMEVINQQTSLGGHHLLLIPHENLLQCDKP